MRPSSSVGLVALGIAGIVAMAVVAGFAMQTAPTALSVRVYQSTDGLDMDYSWPEVEAFSPNRTVALTGVSVQLKGTEGAFPYGTVVTVGVVCDGAGLAHNDVVVYMTQVLQWHTLTVPGGQMEQGSSCSVSISLGVSLPTGWLKRADNGKHNLVVWGEGGSGGGGGGKPGDNDGDDTGNGIVTCPPGYEIDDDRTGGWDNVTLANMTDQELVDRGVCRVDYEAPPWLWLVLVLLVASVVLLLVGILLRR